MRAIILGAASAALLLALTPIHAEAQGKGKPSSPGGWSLIDFTGPGAQTVPVDPLVCDDGFVATIVVPGAEDGDGDGDGAVAAMPRAPASAPAKPPAQGKGNKKAAKPAFAKDIGVVRLVDDRGVPLGQWQISVGDAGGGVVRYKARCSEPEVEQPEAPEPPAPGDPTVPTPPAPQ